MLITGTLYFQMKTPMDAYLKRITSRYNYRVLALIKLLLNFVATQKGSQLTTFQKHKQITPLALPESHDKGMAYDAFFYGDRHLRSK